MRRDEGSACFSVIWDAIVNCCPLCKQSFFRPIIREGAWQYARCGSCGLVFLHPQPSSAFLHEHYQEYLPREPQAIEAWRELMADVIAKSALLIEEWMDKPGKLLDVGCGYGFFLDHMAHRGWQARGIEISTVGRSYARESMGLDVSSEPLPRNEWENGSFDVITLYYVIEHLTDPVLVLKEVHRLLRPGGLLLLRWPHTTPLAMLLKPWSESLKLYQAPSHLFDFSPRTIHRLLAKAGFTGVKTTVCGWTRPKKKGARLASAVSGIVGEALARMSGDRLLLPGVSKTTLAER